MDDNELRWLVRAGFVVLVAGLMLIGYREFERQRDIDEARQLMQSFSDSVARVPNSIGQMAQSQNVAAQQLLRQQQALEHQRWEQQQLDMDRRRLASNQQCMGGTVITQVGSSYTQVSGANGQPVHCTGQFADAPLR